MTGAAAPQTVALRFQRAELEAKAELSEQGLALLGQVPHPARWVEALIAEGQPHDAVRALAMMLPHRQSVWWACLATRLLPDLAARPHDLAAVETAERWVQSVAADEAERAGAAAEVAGLRHAPGWTAMAAFWSGPSIAPRGQQAVPPAPHLPGVAVRAALLLLTFEERLAGRIEIGDWLGIGLALMAGENGRQAQATLRERLIAA